MSMWYGSSTTLAKDGDKQIFFFNLTAEIPM